MNNRLMGESMNEDKNVRVLVIEDNPDDRELLSRQLRKFGIDGHVKFISDGQEALDFLTGTQAPSPSSLIAILLDLNLPSLSGIELLRRLRAHDDFLSTPVMVMTSSNNPADLEECVKLTVANYVSKPVTFTSFSKAVADVFHPPRISPDSATAE
jgi:two-component system, response regulator